MPEELVLPTYDTLLLGYEGGTATVTLNRPAQRNALNAAMFDDLERVFTLLAKDPSIHVVLLAGAGEKAFAAGADISELQAMDTASGERLSRRGQAVMGLIADSAKPVIACMRGYALGGGLELALCCTLRVASEDAKFGLPEAKLGLIPGYGGTQRLSRLIGQAAALQMMLTAQPIDAQAALRLGLVQELAADPLTRGLELAQQISTLAPLATAAILEVAREGCNLPLKDALELESRHFGRLSGTRDKQEGATAFLEKREPRWASD